MKVAVDLTIGKIIDILPDSATDTNKFLLNNDYRLLEVGDPYAEDGSFKELTAVDLRPFLMERTNTEFEQAVEQLTVGIPESEKLTWTKQEVEARAWLIDNTVGTPFIDAILTKRIKYTKAELVGKILEKATAYAVALGALTGEKQQIEDELGE